MSLLGRIFGAPEAIQKTVDSVSRGIDALVYTDQEKAADHASSVTEGRALLIEWLKSSQGFALARRLIALMITTVWLSLYLVSMLVALLAIWSDDPKRLMQSAELLGEHAYAMNGAVMLILAFYFAAPHLGKVVDVAMQRFGKRPNLNFRKKPLNVEG